MTEDVFRCFQAIIEDREEPRFEKRIDEYTGFEMLLVAMYWECRFNHMVKPYNDIYKVQMPNITPHMQQSVVWYESKELVVSDRVSDRCNA